MLVQYPTANVCPQIAGFDDDSRELWEIPEARDYIATGRGLRALITAPPL